jgi:hypothetical protein
MGDSRASRPKQADNYHISSYRISLHVAAITSTTAGETGEKFQGSRLFWTHNA